MTDQEILDLLADPNTTADDVEEAQEGVVFHSRAWELLDSGWNALDNEEPAVPAFTTKRLELFHDDINSSTKSLYEGEFQQIPGELTVRANSSGKPITTINGVMYEVDIAMPEILVYP